MDPANCNHFLALLARLGSIVESAEDLDGFFFQSLRLIEDLLEVEGCSIFLFDQAGGILRIKAATRIPREEWPSIAIRRGEGIVGRVAQQGTPIWATSQEEVSALRPESSANPRTDRYKTFSFISVPVRLGDETVGVINVDSRKDGGAFTEEDCRVLQGVAGLFASALSNSLLLEQRAASNRYFDSILRSVRLGVLVFSDDLRLTHCNHAAADLLGFDPRLAGDAPLATLLPESLRGPLLRLIEELKSDAGHAYREVEGPPRKNDASVPLALSLSALRTGEGASRGYVLVIEDLTLKREIKELRHLSQMHSHFLCMISHELRTPLTAIKGSLHILRDSKSFTIPESHQKIIEIIDRNILRLAALVDDVIEVQSLESESVDLDLAPVAIEELVRDSVKTHSAIWKEKKIRVEVKVNGLGARPLRLDRNRMRYVFNHLVDNAFKFCAPEGHVKIEVGGDDREAWARISNTGKPIPPQIEPKIFDKFYQADSSLTRDARGSGLGLYLARKLCRLHGGDVALERSDEAKTTFLVRLPAQTPGDD